MGQGGKITLVNSTDEDWIKTKEHSYQMNSWSFPDKIESKTSISVYIEWDQGFLIQQADDSGEVDYTMQGSGKTFQIQARAKKGFDLRIYYSTLETHSNPRNTLISLGWNHDGHVAYLLSGKLGDFTSTHLNGASWMEDNLSLLASKKINDICIVGAHDSGMNKYTTGTVFANDCNVLTQSNTVKGQLECGARYFDIRPVISNSNYYTGHYGYIDALSSWQGANGQSIDSIIKDINDFTQVQNELIILNLSHSLNTDLGSDSYRSFNQSEWNALFKKLSKINKLFVSDKNTDLTQKNVQDFISSQASVIIILEDNANLNHYEGNGFYQYSCFDVYNSYANKNTVDEMASDQISKMKAHGGTYFLLSWTLTQDSLQASTCALGVSSSIKDLANEANQRFVDMVYPQVTTAIFPNIIYLDNIVNSDSAAFAMSINWKRQ